MPKMQSSQRHTSSPSIDEVQDPMLDTESMESVRSSSRDVCAPVSAEAISIFLANSISINVLGRVVDDEYNDILATFCFVR